VVGEQLIATETLEAQEKAKNSADASSRVEQEISSSVETQQQDW